MTGPASDIGVRAVQREMVRGRILAAARAAFIAGGIAEPSIDDIATRAGLGRATVYRHFTGKDGLLVGLIVEDWDRQAALYARVPPAGELDMASVRRWLRRLVQATQARRESLPLYSAALVQDSGMGERIAAQRRRLVAVLGDAVPAFVDSDPRRRVEAVLLVTAIEQFCAYAAGDVTAAEIDFGTEIVAEQVVGFAAGRARGDQNE